MDMEPGPIVARHLRYTGRSDHPYCWSRADACTKPRPTAGKEHLPASSPSRCYRRIQRPASRVRKCPACRQEFLEPAQKGSACRPGFVESPLSDTSTTGEPTKQQSQTRATSE